MDWLDHTIEHEVEIQMVTPQAPHQFIGVLEGVDLGSSSIDAAYYTDTRTSGKITTIDDNWQRGSFLRIVVRYPGFEKILGTYLVTDDDTSWENGRWKRTYTLNSVLYGLSVDKGVTSWTVQQGASAMKAARHMLEHCGRPYMIDGNDCSLSSPTVYESGTNYLERLMSLCDMATNRIDVAGDGTVLLRPYQDPDTKSAAFEIDLTAENGSGLDGVQLSSSWLSMPTRYAVAYRWNDSSGGESVQYEVNGEANRQGENSSGARGYTITDFRVLDELVPATKAAADAEAQKLLAESREKVEWRIKSLFLPIWEGDVIDLVVPEGSGGYSGRRHCLVKNVGIDLLHMIMDLTLKETASGDTDD